MQNDSANTVVDKVLASISEEDMRIEEILYALSEALNAAMLSKGMAKADVALKTGISEAIVGDILRGEDATLRNVVMVASAVGLRVELPVTSA